MSHTSDGLNKFRCVDELNKYYGSNPIPLYFKITIIYDFFFFQMFNNLIRTQLFKLSLKLITDKIFLFR
ncbi:MAG: hypothetical protein BAJALOKI2v1_400004 [Promethearchaeota archaeon]|nr:MAG: hypothetical protein BAJALOKI2v1_400004 [Candidatus Lokiarchaeota archaeon]